MRTTYLVALSGLLWTGTALGQGNDKCRQVWMPKDAPVFCPWRSESSLPQPRTYAAVVGEGKNIYVLGGYRYDSAANQVAYYDSVVRSSVGNDGKLGPWVSDQSFKSGRSGAGAAKVGECLFLAGGSSSTSTSLTYYDDVQSAHIGGDGTLASWMTSPHHLHTARSNLSLVAVTTSKGTFLNAVAGVAQIGPDTVHLDTIETAPVTADCSIGEWTVADYHLKGGRSSPQALAIRDSVVVVGGWGDLDLIDVYDDVQIAAARPDGSPAPWRTSPSHLTTGIYGHATAVASSPKDSKQLLLMSVAGQPGTGAYANWISFAYVKKDTAVADAIGIWRIAPTGRLATGLAGLGVAQLGDRLYAIGGNDASGQYHGEVVSAQVDFGEP